MTRGQSVARPASRYGRALPIAPEHHEPVTLDAPPVSCMSLQYYRIYVRLKSGGQATGRDLHVGSPPAPGTCLDVPLITGRVVKAQILCGQSAKRRNAAARSSQRLLTVAFANLAPARCRFKLSRHVWGQGEAAVVTPAAALLCLKSHNGLDIRVCGFPATRTRDRIVVH